MSPPGSRKGAHPKAQPERAPVGRVARAPVLVVGATGQLGSRIVVKLAERGENVRALVRDGSRHEHLRLPNVELVRGDLRDAASIDAACRGARAVAATASSVAPRAGDSFESVENHGYAGLIERCRALRTNHVLYVSTVPTAVDAQVPLFAWKRENERRLQISGLNATVLRERLSPTTGWSSSAARCRCAATRRRWRRGRGTSCSVTSASSAGSSSAAGSR